MEIWVIYNEYVGGIVYGNSDKECVVKEKENYFDEGFKVVKVQLKFIEEE